MTAVTSCENALLYNRQLFTEGAQMTKRPSGVPFYVFTFYVFFVFLPTNKTFEGICLAIVGRFLQKGLRILFVFGMTLLRRLLNSNRQTQTPSKSLKNRRFLFVGNFELNPKGDQSRHGQTFS